MCCKAFWQPKKTFGIPGLNSRNLDKQLASYTKSTSASGGWKKQKKMKDARRHALLSAFLGDCLFLGLSLKLWDPLGYLALLHDLWLVGPSGR